MRLIDAELVAKNIARHKIIALEVGNDEMNKLMECYNPSSFSAGFDYGMKLAMELVANQPTAYDLEEKLQRLEQEKTEDVTTITYEHDIFIDGYREGLCKAIEILKGGAE